MALGLGMKETLERLLTHLDSAPVECDGMSSLVATVLSGHGIAYQAMVGQIETEGGATIPHVWIEVEGWVIDFRARMWRGDHPDVPHGVFCKKAYEEQYRGSPIEVVPLPPFLFEMLCTPFPQLPTKDQGSVPEP